MSIFDFLRASNQGPKNSIYDYIKSDPDPVKEFARRNIVFKNDIVGLAIDEVEKIQMDYIFSKNKHELKRAITIITEARKLNCSHDQINYLNDLEIDCNNKLI